MSDLPSICPCWFFFSCYDHEPSKCNQINHRMIKYHQIPSCTIVISPSNVIVKYHSTSSGRNMVKHTHTHSFPFFSSFLSSFSFALLRFLRGIRLWLRLGLLGFWQRRWLKTMSWQISADQNKLQEDWDTDKNSASIYGYEFNLVGMKLTPTNPPINKQWLSMSDQNINQGEVEMKQPGLLVAAPRPGERCSWNRLNHSEASQATNG